MVTANDTQSALSQATQSELRSYLRGQFRGSLPDEATLLSELDLESLELIEILFELEQRSGRILTNAEYAALSSVGELMGCFGISMCECEGEK